MHSFRKDKKMIEKGSAVIRVIVFACILFLSLNIITWFLSARELNDYPVRNQFIQNIKAEDDDTIDIFFVGDSTVLNAVVPMRLWEQYKITSYNISYSVMKPREAYYDLKRVMQVQNPNVVMLEASFLVDMSEEKTEFGTRETKYFIDLLEDEMVGYFEYVCPIMRNKSEWSKIDAERMMMDIPDSINSCYKGYNFSDVCEGYFGSDRDDRNTGERAVYKYGGDYYLQKINELCIENNCRLVVFSLPHISSWNVEKHNFISQIAEKKQIEYIDLHFNEQGLLDNFSWETDSQDGGAHLNYNGAQKVTTAIGEYLTKYLGVKKSNLLSQQEEKWDKDLEDFYHAIDRK